MINLKINFDFSMTKVDVLVTLVFLYKKFPASLVSETGKVEGG